MKLWWKTWPKEDDVATFPPGALESGGQSQPGCRDPGGLIDFWKGVSLAWNLFRSHGLKGSEISAEHPSRAFLRCGAERRRYSSTHLLLCFTSCSVSPSPSSVGFLHHYSMKKFRKKARMGFFGTESKDLMKETVPSPTLPTPSGTKPCLNPASSQIAFRGFVCVSFLVCCW